MFSKACEYGIRATIFIARESKEDQRIGLKVIADSVGSPQAFTAKILQKLVKAGILVSVKGVNGGFVMHPDYGEFVSLLDIVKAIDGPDVYDCCALGLSECSDDRPCPAHTKFKPVKLALKEMLISTLIKDLVNHPDFNISYLKF